MKLLLTSAGFANETIAKAFLELAGRPFSELKLLFITTAANIEEGGKDWVINDLKNCQKLGFAQIDIIDFASLPKEIWLKRFNEADVLMFDGGNTFYLMHEIEKAGLKEELLKMLKNKIYVGVSAGSMVTSLNLALSQLEQLYYEGRDANKEIAGLGLVNFHIRPHFNSPDFPKVRAEYLAELAKEIPEPIYALDDNSAVKVDGQKISVVSEGEWKKFN